MMTGNEFAERIKNMKKEVRVYTRSECQYCDYAKELLTERGIPYREIDVGEDYVLRGWLAWATGQRTLPQIFINGEPIGGFSDLMKMDAVGELRRRTQDISSPDVIETVNENPIEVKQMNSVQKVEQTVQEHASSFATTQERTKYHHALERTLDRVLKVENLDCYIIADTFLDELKKDK